MLYWLGTPAMTPLPPEDINSSSPKTKNFKKTTSYILTTKANDTPIKSLVQKSSNRTRSPKSKLAPKNQCSRWSAVFLLALPTSVCWSMLIKSAQTPTPLLLLLKTTQQDKYQAIHRQLSWSVSLVLDNRKITSLNL